MMPLSPALAIAATAVPPAKRAAWLKKFAERADPPAGQSQSRGYGDAQRARWVSFELPPRKSVKRAVMARHRDVPLPRSASRATLPP
jgi:hypothetical protein